MSEETTIRLDDLDTAGQAFVRFDDPRDADRFRDRAVASDGQIRVKIARPEEDTEGHVSTWSGGEARALLLTGDDTEGHAITVRFPSAEQADAFRRRMLAGGVLAGTLIVGGVAGAAISSAVSRSPAEAAPAAAPDSGPALTPLDDVKRPPGRGELE